MRVVLLRRGTEIGSWLVDLPADLHAVDALGRIRLLAARVGCTVALRDAAPDLRGLLDLCGLGCAFED